MLYRRVSLLIGVLALGLYLAGSGLQAQENKNQQRPGSATGGTSATAAQAHSWQGRIGDVDVAKREITLANVKHVQSPAGSKTGTTPSTSGTSGTSGTSTTGTQTGTGTKATMAFTVSQTATITLDGKTATLSDLKAGQYARLSSTKAAGNKAGTGTSGTSGTSSSGSRTGSGTDSGAAGKAHHTVDRVEVFTKEPASFGAGGRTGTSSGPIK